MEIIKIAPETLEALQNAPCAQPPHPLPMAEAGEAVKEQQKSGAILPRQTPRRRRCSRSSACASVLECRTSSIKRIVEPFLRFRNQLFQRRHGAALADVGTVCQRRSSSASACRPR